MDIYSDLIAKTGFSTEYIRTLSQRTLKSSSLYHTFFIKKSITKKRRIEAPVYDLKYIQNCILEILEKNIHFDECVQGFISGRSFISNAQKHINKPYILMLDIKNFFPSIYKENVYRTLLHNNYTSNAEIITNLLTYKDKLPQGAPTSPFIANIIFNKYDDEILSFCENHNMTYTRYADDITISSDEDNLKTAYNNIKKVLKSSPFKLNSDKTCFTNINVRQEITGIVVNPERDGHARLKMKKSWRKNIRAGFYNAIKDPFKYRNKYTYFSGCLNLLKQLNKYNTSASQSDIKLISLGEECLKKVKKWVILNKIEKFLKIK